MSSQMTTITANEARDGEDILILNSPSLKGPGTHLSPSQLPAPSLRFTKPTVCKVN